MNNIIWKLNASTSDKTSFYIISNPGWWVYSCTLMVIIYSSSKPCMNQPLALMVWRSLGQLTKCPFTQFLKKPDIGQLVLSCSNNRSTCVLPLPTSVPTTREQWIHLHQLATATREWGGLAASFRWRWHTWHFESRYL